MTTTKLPIGSFACIEKEELQAVVDRLKELGYQTIGPQISDSAIVYDQINSLGQLPIGMTDEQDGGLYRLRKNGADTYFDYVVGPQSLKGYLFPPHETVLESERKDGKWQMTAPEVAAQPLAVFGVRSCDLHALKIQDRVFLGDHYVDTAYQARRKNLFLVAVNCGQAAATCFCHSMDTGPTVSSGFDLAITELEGLFVVEVGSERGGEMIATTHWTPCTMAQIEEAQAISTRLREQMDHRSESGRSTNSDKGPRKRSLDTTDIHDLLLNNLEHPRWQKVAERCLACANCTMVCPTCFCCSVEDISDLSGDQVKRERSWDSCFTAEHSYTNTGTVHKATASRYRQWLTHKLATWTDQFGTSGCVGCGRCITWCPVGIDLTEEVASIRRDVQ